MNFVPSVRDGEGRKGWSALLLTLRARARGTQEAMSSMCLCFFADAGEGRLALWLQSSWVMLSTPRSLAFLWRIKFQGRPKKCF